MISFQWKAEYQNEFIVWKVIQLIQLNQYIISILHQNFEAKSYDSLFNDLNIISNQTITLLKSFAISRIHICYQKSQLDTLYCVTKFL